MNERPDFVEQVLSMHLPREKRLAEQCLQDKNFLAGMTPDYDQLMRHVKQYVAEVLLANEKEQSSHLARLCIEEAESSFLYSAIALVCGERVYGLPWAIAITFLHNLAHAMSKFGYRFAAPMVLDAEGNVTVILKKEDIQAEEEQQEGSGAFGQTVAILDGDRNYEQSIEHMIASLSRRARNRRRHDD